MSDFQDLLLIATGRNPEFLSVHAQHPDVFLTLRGDDDKYFTPFGVLAHWQMRDNAKKPDQIEHHDLFFTFDDLGGMVGVKQWMDMAAKFRSSLGRLTSTKATKSMFVSDRLLNYTAVLEGIDRQKTGIDRQDLPVRLRRCAEIAGTPFEKLVGHTNTWAECLTWHRNDIAHHLGRPLQDSAGAQANLSTSAYWLTVHLLLREAQLPDAVFERLVKHQEFSFIAPKIKAVVNSYRRPS